MASTAATFVRERAEEGWQLCVEESRYEVHLKWPCPLLEPLEVARVPFSFYCDRTPARECVCEHIANSRDAALERGEPFPLNDL